MNNYLLNDIPVSIPETFDEIKLLFDDILSSNKKKYISFLNPEIFIYQEYNIFLKNYLKNSNYNFVDGIGLLFLINHSTKSKYKWDNRYPGTDFLNYLPEHKEIRLFLFGARKNKLISALDNIKLKYKNILIVGIMDGYSDIPDEDLVEKINISQPDIVIVCLGCPKQELWIHNNFDKINTKLIFGNGGSIDFWSGHIKRAPDFMIKHGIEWFYRLLQDFNLKRIKRQIRLIPFSINILMGKYKVFKNENTTNN